MARLLITLLTTATMLAHGLFGCCWHHEHVHGAGTVETTATAPAGHRHAATHQHQGPACHAVDEHDDASESPCPSECDAERCVFVRTSDGATFDASDMTTSAAFEATLPSADRATMSQQNRRLARPVASPIDAAPLHARLRVWLI